MKIQHTKTDIQKHDQNTCSECTEEKMFELASAFMVKMNSRFHGAGGVVCSACGRNVTFSTLFEKRNLERLFNG